MPKDKKRRDKQPCPSCGHCPHCGHTPDAVKVIPVPMPYPVPAPQPAPWVLRRPLIWNGVPPYATWGGGNTSVEGTLKHGGTFAVNSN